MKVKLTEPERAALRQLQKQRRDEAGYVKVRVVLMLDAGWGAGQVAQALDDGTVYRYARAWERLGLEKYLAYEASGYWGGPADLRQLRQRPLLPQPGTGRVAEG